MLLLHKIFLKFLQLLSKPGTNWWQPQGWQILPLWEQLQVLKRACSRSKPNLGNKVNMNPLNTFKPPCEDHSSLKSRCEYNKTVSGSICKLISANVNPELLLYNLMKTVNFYGCCSVFWNLVSPFMICTHKCCVINIKILRGCNCNYKSFSLKVYPMYYGKQFFEKNSPSLYSEDSAVIAD